MSTSQLLLLTRIIYPSHSYKSSYQSVPSEELGPASVHVKSKGFGVSVASEISLVVESMPSKVDSIDTASCTRESESSGTKAVLSAADAVRNGGLESSTGNSNGNGNSNSDGSSIPVGPRVYPPSKPHQGSGRQAESLVRLKEELRNGVDRWENFCHMGSDITCTFIPPHYAKILCE